MKHTQLDPLIKETWQSIKPQFSNRDIHVVRWQVNSELTRENPVLIASFVYTGDAQAFAKDAANRSNREYVSGFALSFAIHNHKGEIVQTFLNDAAFNLVDMDCKSRLWS